MTMRFLYNIRNSIANLRLRHKLIVNLIYNAAIELVFPKRCPVCDKVLKRGERICISCRPRLTKVSQPKCLKCGKGLGNDNAELCQDCFNTNHIFEQGVALYEYNSICDSLYKFKYFGRAEYAEYFGVEMAKNFEKLIRSWKIDAILSVPMYKTKENDRGYNQAALLAENMSKYLKIPYYRDFLIRKRNTIPLKKLDPKARQINLKNAFIIKLYDVKLNRVIIVDDIYTTGSTIDEIAGLLKKNGVQKVYFVTLSIGKGL